MTDRDTKRKLFAEHVAANPPSEAKKTKALEQRYGHLDSKEMAAIVAVDDAALKRSARESTIFVVLAILALVLFLLLVGCAPVDAAVDHAQRQAVLVAADACDRSLPLEARAIASDCFDSWGEQVFILTGKPLDAELVARVRAGTAEVSSR